MLEDTLASLDAVSISNIELELIIVDNNSTDETRGVVEKYQTSGRIQTRYVFEEKQGLAIARNTGVRYACAEIIIFTDDDILFDKRFLKEIRDTFTISKASAVGGRILLQFPKQKPNWLSDRVDYMYGKMDLGVKNMEFPLHTSPLGPCIAIRRNMFNQYGLFDEELGLAGSKEVLRRGEETEFVERLRKRGEKIFYSGNALVLHRVQLNRLNKPWFYQRFKYEGAVRGAVTSKLSLFWWMSLCKLLIVNILGMFGTIIGNPKLEFYGKCKAIYFLGVISNG